MSNSSYWFNLADADGSGGNGSFPVHCSQEAGSAALGSAGRMSVPIASNTFPFELPESSITELWQWIRKLLRTSAP